MSFVGSKEGGNKIVKNYKIVKIERKQIVRIVKIVKRMSRRRAFVVYQINAIGRRGPTAFLSQQGQPATSLLLGFLQFGH